MTSRILIALTAAALMMTNWLPVSEAASAFEPSAVTFGGRAPEYDSDQSPHFLGRAGSTSGLVVDFRPSGAGTYTIKDDCDGNTADREIVVPEDPAAQVVTIPMPSTTAKQICYVWFWRDFGEGGNQMYQTPVVLHLLSTPYRTVGFTTVNGPDFYPKVPGHPDVWRARFLANAPTTATVRVRNGAGRLVYAGTRYSKRVLPDDFTIDQWEVLPTWNGRTTGGSPVRLGTYRVTIQAVSSLGTGSQRIGPVRAVVKAGRRTLTASQRKIGSVAVGRSDHGCGAQRQPNGWMWLNCSISAGAGSASATWVFTVPSGAKVVGWRIKTYLGGDDKAGQGSIIRSVSRLSPTRVQLRVRITGKRSILVDDCALTYTYLQ